MNIYQQVCIFTASGTAVRVVRPKTIPVGLARAVKIVSQSKSKSQSVGTSPDILLSGSPGLVPADRKDAGNLSEKAEELKKTATFKTSDKTSDQGSDSAGAEAQFL